MTDNEIIKALECCMNGRCDDDCPFRETRENCHNLDNLILDLINRQKAEIERYREVVGELGVKDGEVVALLNGKETAYTKKDIAETLKRMAVKTAKAEAIKDVFEKVEERLAVHHFTSNSTEYTDGQLDCMEWVDSKIDELKKEMVGDV